jgi:hypothetical protein
MNPAHYRWAAWEAPGQLETEPFVSTRRDVSAPDVEHASAPDVLYASAPDVLYASAPDVLHASAPDVEHAQQYRSTEIPSADFSNPNPTSKYNRQGLTASRYRLFDDLELTRRRSDFKCERHIGSADHAHTLQQIRTVTVTLKVILQLCWDEPVSGDLE